jgi:DNA-binding MarR family transcriptional regulator
MTDTDLKSAADELLLKTKTVLKLDPVLSVSTLACLLYIASHPDCAAADLVRNIGLAQPAVTRHLQRLSSGSPGDSGAVGRGLELVSWGTDPEDSRRRLYALNEAGREFVISLVQ